MRPNSEHSRMGVHRLVQDPPESCPDCGLTVLDDDPDGQPCFEHDGPDNWWVVALCPDGHVVLDYHDCDAAAGDEPA